jgi:hypothetical protein
MQSAKFTLNSSDLVAIGKGLLIALAGAAATYLAGTVSKLDFGNYTLIVAALVSTIVNLLRKFAAGPVEV